MKRKLRSRLTKKEEREWININDKRHLLIDKMFLETITPEEKICLERIERRMDQLERIRDGKANECSLKLFKRAMKELRQIELKIIKGAKEAK